MTPLLGISLLVLAALCFVAYILFLIGQHRLQDELARRFRRKEEERWIGGDASVLTAPFDDFRERQEPLE